VLGNELMCVLFAITIPLDLILYWFLAFAITGVALLVSKIALSL
jgi:hypothetical protein